MCFLKILLFDILYKKYALVVAVPLDDVNEKKRYDTKDNPLNQWFKNFSEADELLQLAAARQQVSMNSCFPFAFIISLVHGKIVDIVHGKFNLYGNTYILHSSGHEEVSI